MPIDLLRKHPCNRIGKKSLICQQHRLAQKQKSISSIRLLHLVGLLAQDIPLPNPGLPMDSSIHVFEVVFRRLALLTTP